MEKRGQARNPVRSMRNQILRLYIYKFNKTAARSGIMIS